MEFPPFPLSPLDDGKPSGRVPRAVARVEIDGQSWILRPCNGLLFARREDQNTQEWTFSTTKQLADGETNSHHLCALWNDAVQKREIARVVVFEPSFLYRALPLFFAEDGKGWMREFWNRDDFPFSWNGQEDVFMCPEEKLKALCENVFGQFLFQPLDNWCEDHPNAPRYVDEALHFIYGSQNELERLCRIVCWSDNLIALSHTPIQMHIRSESGEHRAEVGKLSFAGSHFYQPHPDDREQLDIEKWHPDSPPLHCIRLLEMAIEENTPVGYYWEYNDQGAGRASHSPESITLYFSFSPPSWHEHLEAKLELRHWLQSRVSPEELQELLGE